MATSLDITICQGSTYSLHVQANRSAGVPWDLSAPGTTIAAKLRPTFDSASAVSFTATITTAANGEFDISLTATETAALAGPGGQERLNRWGVYDIELTEGTTVTRILEGRVALSQEATK